MYTRLARSWQASADGREAKEIVSRCVHCGFCTATCPTYQLLGDELDGPRGRIYLIKQVLEGHPVGAATQLHLDRCLGCRSCETTCPSGVEYGHLLEIGRRMVEREVGRAPADHALRWSLREGLTSALFAPALKLGQALRGWLPPVLRASVPAPQDAGIWPRAHHARRVLLLEGCVQPSLRPNINAASARVLDALGVEVVRTPRAGCCGAIRQHLGDADGARDQMRANIDAWWPWIARDAVEAIAINASGCGATVKEYGYLLRNDRAYAERAERVSALACDISEVLARRADELRARIAPAGAERVVFHPPCTLTHALKLRASTESLLRALGLDLLPLAEAHLCCGSAGTYSLLQPELAGRLRARKLDQLLVSAPDRILSANIGCIAHLQGATHVPVEHWIEWLDRRMGRPAGALGSPLTPGPSPASGRGEAQPG